MMIIITMILTKCSNYISVTGLAEVANRNNVITNSFERTAKEILKQIRVLFAYYEMVEATTILKLAIWEGNVDEFDDGSARTREECHVICGANGVIHTVLSFI